MQEGIQFCFVKRQDSSQLTKCTIPAGFARGMILPDPMAVSKEPRNNALWCTKFVSLLHLASNDLATLAEMIENQGDQLRRWEDSNNSWSKIKIYDWDWQLTACLRLLTRTLRSRPRPRPRTCLPRPRPRTNISALLSSSALPIHCHLTGSMFAGDRHVVKHYGSLVNIIVISLLLTHQVAVVTMWHNGNSSF